MSESTKTSESISRSGTTKLSPRAGVHFSPASRRARASANESTPPSCVIPELGRAPAGATLWRRAAREGEPTTLVRMAGSAHPRRRAGLLDDDGQAMLVDQVPECHAWRPPPLDRRHDH